MRTRSKLVLLMAAMAVYSGPTSAADVSHGRQIARRWCASCHVVAANQRQSSTEAPTFASIARRPNFDAGRLATFLMNPYPRMPSMSLTRIEAADVAAYIGSLRR